MAQSHKLDRLEECLDSIERNGHLNAIITLTADTARRRGRLVAQSHKLSEGPLAGVPVLVKDLIDTAGVRTTYGSKIYADHVPVRTAPVVERLEAAGAIVVGKSNLDEFAWGVAGQNPHWGDVGNPRLPGRLAGGSSGGSAAGIAAGLCDLALGTDTGGSVRMPAACCGIVGFKPTPGAISTDGVYPLCPSFDTVGPMARTVAECALAYSVLTGEPEPEPRLEGLKVGLLDRPPPVGDKPPPADGRAFAYGERFEALGANVVEAELPGPGADTTPLFFWEAAESHRETFPARRDEYGDTCRAKLDLAQRVTREEADEVKGAVLRWRARLAREPAVDIFVTPTLGVPDIPPAGTLELEIRLAFSHYTRPFNYAGWAAIAIGELQIAGRDNATVLGAALAWERAYGPP